LITALAFGGFIFFLPLPASSLLVAGFLPFGFAVY
jgi:hypothetical protein